MHVGIGGCRTWNYYPAETTPRFPRAGAGPCRTAWCGITCIMRSGVLAGKAALCRECLDSGCGPLGHVVTVWDGSDGSWLLIVLSIMAGETFATFLHKEL